MNQGILAENCKHCPEYGETCEGNEPSCICFRCPRNLGQCIIVKYCRETESVLELATPLDSEREMMIERYYKLKNME
ncbi:hypothetical protein KCG48_11820 [Proteiniclasticum sp. BAD-10]|jgi:hypothetical protein|uniref:Uncharacterized protein n=1 Tax=Proteiniclasticum sediminis TaxID=2804028 RepID=A0A941HRV7_9CLOT|nr:hypothetical protein [Proteiniclasticum sediminis]MBR0577003.1 hypothetical protein [Proteiniclasticum sediminis]